VELFALETFLAVAESGSFSQAAARLHRSQPAVSKRIAALEAELGRPLFDRIGRRARLTDAGRALLPHAQRVREDLEDARRALSHLAGAIAGRLAVGTSHHIGLHRLPPVLRAYAQKYPGVDLDLHFMDSEDVCEAVLRGTLELGIVTLPLRPLPNLETRRIWPDPLAVVVAPDHPLAHERRPLLADLAAHPAVLPDEHTYTHRIVRRELARHRLKPHVRLATNYLETLKMLVAIGLGWSVLPRTMLDRSIRPLDFPQLSLQRELGAVWHRRRARSAAAQALLALLAQQV
jgi:DNA-binding transcriptional LysR family regulator